MNEQVKLLVEQAEQYAVDEAHETDDDDFTYEASFQAKFVKLIIQECIAICNETHADYHKHGMAAHDFNDKHIYAEGANASNKIKHKIKKQFGVEE